MERLRKKLPNSGPVTLCVETLEGFNEDAVRCGILLSETPPLTAGALSVIVENPRAEDGG